MWQYRKRFKGGVDTFTRCYNYILSHLKSEHLPLLQSSSVFCHVVLHFESLEENWKHPCILICNFYSKSAFPEPSKFYFPPIFVQLCNSLQVGWPHSSGSWVTHGEKSKQKDSQGRFSWAPRRPSCKNIYLCSRFLLEKSVSFLI